MSTKKNEIINKINQLTKQIIEHNENYHTHDNPKITDSQYDDLKREIFDLEKWATFFAIIPLLPTPVKIIFPFTSFG